MQTDCRKCKRLCIFLALFKLPIKLMAHEYGASNGVYKRKGPLRKTEILDGCITLEDSRKGYLKVNLIAILEL